MTRKQQLEQELAEIKKQESAEKDCKQAFKLVDNRPTID